LITPLLRNVTVVGLSMGACFGGQIVGGLIGRKLFPDGSWTSDSETGTDPIDNAKKLEKRRKDFNINFVAFFHATLASILCLYTIFTLPPKVVNNVYAYSPESETIFSISTGYFLWDTIVSIVFSWGPGFISHGIACSAVYGFSLFPFLHYWGLYFLLYELSTPFLHLRWLSLQLGVHKTRPVLFGIIQYTFVVVFILVRIVLGTLASYQWWGQMIALLSGTYNGGVAPHSKFVVFAYLGANIVLNGLNWLWFAQIISTAMGRGGARKPKDKDKLATTVPAGDGAAPSPTTPSDPEPTTTSGAAPASPTGARRRTPKDT